MKKSNLVVSALAASMLLLAGCNNDNPDKPDEPEEPACAHVDTNPKDHICDLCGEELSQCVDENPKDHICDYCGKELSEHLDENPKDHICDYCGEELSQCVDTNPKDHYCDYCGEKLSDHVDTNNDHVCDYCNGKASDHIDEDPSDHYCDICGEKISDHVDEDPKDHNCDICGEKLSEHADEDPKDHYCDYCGEKLSEHVDTDNDHICDYCNEKASDHVDEDPSDHYCDICGEKVSDHLDEDGDCSCDICGAELDGIKEVKITSKRSYIGAGESFTMSGEAVTSGSVTNDAVTFSTESSLVGLEQDGKNVKVTAGSSKGTASIKAVSVEDSSKEKSIDIKVEAWSTTSKNRMSGSSGVLDGANLPYFRTMSDLLKPMGATTVTGQVDLPEYEEAIQALLDGGYSKVEEGGKVFYVKDHPSKLGFGIQVEIQGVEIDDPEAGYYNFIGSLYTQVLSEFPLSEVQKVIGSKSTSEIPAPTDGTEFMVLRNDGSLIEIQLNGDASAFISKLETGSYYINRDNTRTGYTSYVMSASPERTLLVHVSVKDGAYTITYTTQTIPNKSDWTSSEKNVMNTNFGYVLPFVNVGLTFSSTKGYYSTQRVEAYDMVVAAYQASADFELIATELPAGEGVTIPGYMFAHTLDSHSELRVMIYRSGAYTYVQPYIEYLTATTWDSAYIANIMGTNPAGEVLAEADGTGFEFLDRGNQVVQVNVYGGSMSDYLTKLDGLGYSLTLGADGSYSGYSPKHSMFVMVADLGDYFGILAYNEFESGYSVTLPTSAILSRLGLESADGIVLPAEGSLFHLISNGNFDITLEILESGNMANFVTALGEASFVETELDSGIYTKGNIQITVIAGESGVYSINYTLIEKPEITGWSQDALELIGILLNYEEWEIRTELPYPTTVSSVDVDLEGWVLTINGGNFEEYVQQLTDEGFDIYPAGTGAYVIYEDPYAGSYGPLVVIDQGNGTYVIVGDWVLG